MNIVLLSRYFPPEIGTAANLFFELARGLSKNGHSVTVVTGFPWYNMREIPNKYKKKFFMMENGDGFKVIRIKSPIWGPIKLKLAYGHLTAPLCSIIGGLMPRNIDVVYIYSPPLFMGISGWTISLFKNVPFIMGVQDLHPQCYIDQGVLKNKVLIKILEAIEKFCYKTASYITVHSEGNKAHIVKFKNVPSRKVQVLPNWIDTDELVPLPRSNWFSEKYNLDGKFVVGYAGTLGMSQGLLSIIDAAELLKDNKDILFFIVGDGIEKSTMLERANKKGLNNIRFLPMQPKEVYPWVLAASDVQLVTLNKRVKTPVVPSKILSIMAAGRPLIGSMPLEGDAPRLIKEANCGLCVGPESGPEIAKAVLELKNNHDLREELSTSGRSYVVENLSLKKLVSRLEEIFERAIEQKQKKI